MTPPNNKTQGQQTLEEAARQAQIGMMHAAQLQFVSCVTSAPPPSRMPVEVRRHMWNRLTQTRQLFAPQSEAEVAFYEQKEDENAS